MAASASRGPILVLELCSGRDLHRAGRGSLCSWAATLPPDDDEEEAREVCIESLQGVRLSPASLVREPVYLGNHEEQRAWFRDQAALYRGFQNEPVA